MNIYQNDIFLDETVCVLNKKMMPDVTVMVPGLEMGQNNRITMIPRVVPQYYIVIMTDTK
jgi:hypothetical protein